MLLLPVVRLLPATEPNPILFEPVLLRSAFCPMAVFWRPIALLALLFILTLQLIATLLLYYAVPLVIFRDAVAVAAMQSSARACLRNVLPLFVFSLIYSGILIVVGGIAGILGRFGLLLPAVVLLPWTIGMISIAPGSKSFFQTCVSRPTFCLLI